jgi:hypothetical protein
MRRWSAERASAKAEARPAVDGPRFTAARTLLLCSCLLAMVSGFMALRFATTLWWPAALLLSAAWGVVIYELNRLVLAGFPGGSRVVKSAVVVVRVIVVALVGVIVATPIILTAFSEEIDDQLAVTRDENAQTYQRRISLIDSTIGDLTAERAQLRDLQTGRTDQAVAEDPQVVAATAAYNKALADYEAAQNAATCELVGSCGTGVPGVGAQYRERQQEVMAARDTLVHAQAELDNVTTAVTKRLSVSVSSDVAAGAQQQISDIDLQLANERAHRQKVITEAQSAQRIGPLAKVTAFQDLAATNSTIIPIALVLFGTVVLINALPLPVMAFAPTGRPTGSTQQRAMKKPMARALYRNWSARRALDFLGESSKVEAARRRTMLEVLDALASDATLLPLLEAPDDAKKQRVVEAVVSAVHELGTMPVPTIVSDTQAELNVAPQGPALDRPLWQAVTDGVGGALDPFGATHTSHTPLPPFESTLAVDVARLHRALVDAASRGITLGPMPAPSQETR